MLLLKGLLYILALAGYSLGSDVDLNLSDASADSFDVVKFGSGPALTTRITPKDGIYVNKVLDTFDNVWSPLSKDFALKSFEIHQRSGHNDLGHLVVSEPSQFLLEDDDSARNNTNEALNPAFTSLSNLFFAKRDNVWYPLTQYHFDVLKDEMSSNETTLDLHNFTDLDVMVTYYNSVTKYYLLARRFSHIVRVDHKGEKLWAASNKQLFKSAYLSYDKQNELVLVKMTLSKPNVTYDPFDTKSTRYYVEMTMFFSRFNGSTWREVGSDEYDRSLDVLLKNFKEDESRSVRVALDLSDKAFDEYKFQVSHFNNKGIEVSVYKAQQGFKMNLVKDNDNLLWASEDPEKYCEDVYVYNLGNGSLVVDMKLLPDQSSYKFFKKENGSWNPLNMDDYKHYLHTNDISLPVHLDNLSYEFLTKTSYKEDGVPLSEVRANKGYYFHQVKHRDTTLWDGTRFQRCHKVFLVNSCGYEFLSLLVENPLTGKSHFVYFERRDNRWLEVSEAFYSSLFVTVQLKSSFEFNLGNYLMSNFFLNQLDKFPRQPENDLDEQGQGKYFKSSMYHFKGVPLVSISPEFEYNLSKVTEGSELIWSKAKGYNTIAVSFNASPQPVLLRVSFSDNFNPMVLTYFHRKDGQWVEVLYEDYYKILNAMADVQQDKYFTFNATNLVPSNKYTYDIYYDTVPTAKVVPNNGYHLRKFVVGYDTLWQDTDNKNDKGFEEFFGARVLPYKDPKFVTITTLTKDFDIVFNYFFKNELDPNNPSWEKLEFDEFYLKMDEFILNYSRNEEVVDLADVYKGMKRDYYTLEDSKFFTIENFGLLTFKERVENLTLYVRGIKLYSFSNSHLVKEVVFVPSDNPRCIRLVFQNKGQELKKYFVKDVLGYGYKSCEEEEYMKEFFRFTSKKYTVHLDLSYYYGLVDQYNRAYLSFQTTETLTSFVSSKLEEKYPVKYNESNPEANEFVWGVYNYHDLDILTLELSPKHVLSSITDGKNKVTSCHYSERVKLYLNLTGDHCLSLYHKMYDSKDFNLLNFREVNGSWSLVFDNNFKVFTTLMNFASKPVALDLFHLLVPRAGESEKEKSESDKSKPYKITTFETFKYNVNSLKPKPGYLLNKVFYNSHLLFDTREGLPNNPNLQDKLLSVLEVEFYPRIRPRLIHLAVTFNNYILNRYYHVENTTSSTDGNKPTTTLKTLNVFDYYSMLEELDKMDEFSLDVTASISTDDYSVTTELVYNSEYLLVTPHQDRYMVLLTKGDLVIWEADNERVTKVLLYPKHNPVLVMVYYTNSNANHNSSSSHHNGEQLAVKRFLYSRSVKKWLEVSEDYALDTIKLSKSKMKPFTLDLETLKSKSTMVSKSYFFGNYYSLERKNLYGLLFTVVKPSYNHDLVKLKDKGQVLFNIHDTLDVLTDESHSFESVTGSGNRVLNVLFGPGQDYKLLRVTYLKNFSVLDTYFRKNDFDTWEEVTSPEFGRALWLVKRFSLVPVVLNVDNPNPLLFTTVVDSTSKNNELSRILPNDKYHVTRVVCNATNPEDPNFAGKKSEEKKEEKLVDLDSEVQPTNFLFGSDDVSVLYAETTKYEPRLLRLYYTDNTDFLQVNKKHFAFRKNTFEEVSQSEFDKLLSLSFSLSNLVTYNLDPFYRTYFHTSLAAPKYLTRRYSEVRETVFDDSINQVYPRKGYDIDKLVFKDKTLWKSSVDEEGVMLVTYPPKQPVRAMIKFKNTLAKTIGVQYFDYKTETTEPGDVPGWVKGYSTENELVDHDVNSNSRFSYELSDTKVNEQFNKFTYVRDGVYTTVVTPSAGVKVSGLFDGNTKVWAPKVNDDAFDKVTGHEGEQELVKFYYAPSYAPTVLVVEYKDFDGVVRVKDFKKANSEWKEADSEFMSLYHNMLESSFTLDVNKPLDKEKLIVTEYNGRGFKVTTVSSNSGVINKIVASETDNTNYPDTKETKVSEKLIWSSTYSKRCFMVQFAPKVNPKVLMLTHSNRRSFIETKFFYKDPQKGWTQADKANYQMFTDKLMDLEYSFVYNLKEVPTVPSHNYSYEITNLFGAYFATITPKNKRKMIGVNDHWRYLYQRKEGELLLDLMVSPPKDPKFACLMVGDALTKTTTTKYFRRETAWVEVNYDDFLKSLTGVTPDLFKPVNSEKHVNLNELHEKLLNKLSRFNSSDFNTPTGEESDSVDKVLGSEKPESEKSEEEKEKKKFDFNKYEMFNFKPFTVDLDDVLNTHSEESCDLEKLEGSKKTNKEFSVKKYVESTVERAVLRVKPNYVLTELKQGDDSVWKLEDFDSSYKKPSEDSESTDSSDVLGSGKSDSEKPAYKFNRDTLVVTDVYFAPSNDPKVVTVFFKNSKSGPSSLRYVKEDKWTKYLYSDTDLTNEFSLLKLTNKSTIDLDHEPLRLGDESLYKKILVCEDHTYFMEIQARNGTPNNTVKVVDRELVVWDKGAGEEFVSLRVYPLSKPKFAKIALKVGEQTEFKYYRKYKNMWFNLLEPGYKNSLQRYFKHMSSDFLSVDLSKPDKYSRDTLYYASYYRTLHKVVFRSLTPINYFKISDVNFTVGGDDTPDQPNDYNREELLGDGDESDLDVDANKANNKNVIFETTSNEQIRMVSFAPMNDPKFLAVMYNSTATLIQPDLKSYFNGAEESIHWNPTTTFSSDYSYFSGVPSNVFDQHDQVITGPFYPSAETNFYYKEGDKWYLTDDATFKQMCLKYADETTKRTTPLDVDLDRLRINEDKFSLSSVDISGAFFTKLTPNEGFSLSHIYQYNKVVYREGLFPIVDLCFFPRASPKFLKVAHQMSNTLVNNYYFVSYENLGWFQRDYIAFKNELYQFLNQDELFDHSKKLRPLDADFKPEESKKSDSESTDSSEESGKSESEVSRSEEKARKDSEDLIRSLSVSSHLNYTPKLVLYGITDRTLVTKTENGDVTTSAGNQFLYYVDSEKNDTSAFSYNYDTNSVEFKKAFKTFSGNMYKLNYYMVVPTSNFVTQKLFDNTNLLFSAQEGYKVLAVVMSPKNNPRYLMVNHMSVSGIKFFQLYHLKDDRWLPYTYPPTLLRYKLKNILNYHLSGVFPDDTRSPLEPVSEEYELQDLNKSTDEESKKSDSDSTVNKSESEEKEKSKQYTGFFKTVQKKTNDQYLLHGHFEHPEVTEHFDFTYDALKNATYTTSNEFDRFDSNKYLSSNFKFYYEDEDSYKLVYVDDPNYKLTKLTFNGLTVFDTENVLHYTNKSNEFKYDLAVYNISCTDYKVERNLFEENGYTLVKVSDGSRLTQVLDGNLKVWDSSNKLVKRFVYFPPENPNRFFVSYLDGSETEEKYDYLYKEEGKWVRFDERNKLELASTHPFFSSQTLEKPVRLIKGVLLSPPHNPTNVTVLYTENNFDKYASFVKYFDGRSDRWLNVKLSMVDNVSMRIKFVTATLRSNSVVFTGLHPYVKNANTGFMSYATTKLIHDSLSAHKWFFVYNPDKGHFVYLPINNFKLNIVSFGKKELYKYDFHAKEVTSVHLTTDLANLSEDESTSFRTENVVKVTVLVTDLDNKGRRFTWKRDSNNNWVRASLTTEEVEKLFKHVNQAKELSPGSSATISTLDKTFFNFMSYTDNDSPYNKPFESSEDSQKLSKSDTSSTLFLSGNVTRPSSGVNTTAFFNYNLENNEMDTFLKDVETRFYNYKSKNGWYDFKVVVVPEGYNATVLRTRDYFLFNTRKAFQSNQNTTGDENVINAVYMTPSTNPYRVYLYMTNKYGDKTFKYFYKPSQYKKFHDSNKSVSTEESKKSEESEKQEKESELEDGWVETTMTPSHTSFVKNRMEEAMAKSKSLRLALFNYDLKAHFGETKLHSYKELRHFDFYVDTDSLYPNVTFKSVYTLMDDAEDYKVLVPFKENNVSHVTYGTETLFTLKSQFHTVRAVLFTPAENPTNVVVYYVDDKGSDFYETYSKQSFTPLLVDTNFCLGTKKNTMVSVKFRPMEKLLTNTKNQWHHKPFLFGDVYGIVSKIHNSLDKYQNAFPHLFRDSVEYPELSSSSYSGKTEKKSETRDRRSYNLDVFLSGVYRPQDNTSMTYDFVYYFDPSRKDSVTVFDQDTMSVKRNAFDVVLNDTKYKNYLYLRPHVPEFTVNSVVAGDQEVLALEHGSVLLSMTLTPSRDPRAMMVSVRDSEGRDLYYYVVKKNGRWDTPGTDLGEYMKLKLYSLSGAEQVKSLPKTSEPSTRYNLQLYLSGLYGKTEDPDATFTYYYDPSRKDSVTVFDHNTMYEQKGAFDVLSESGENDYLLFKPNLPEFVVTSVVYGSEELLAVDQYSLLRYVLVSPSNDPTFMTVLLTDANSKNFLFYYKVNNRWVYPFDKYTYPNFPEYGPVFEHANAKYEELEKAEQKLLEFNKEKGQTTVYLSGLYSTKNQQNKTVNRSFIYYYDPKRKDTATLFQSDDVFDKKGAFNVLVDKYNSNSYLTVAPTGPEFRVDHVFTDGEQMILLDNSSKFLSATWYPLSNPDYLMVSTEANMPKSNEKQYYDHLFKKVDGKWTKHCKEVKAYQVMKQFNQNALAHFSFNDLKAVEPVYNLDLYLTGENWTRDPVTDELVFKQFVWFYDRMHADSVYVFDEEKVVRVSGALEVFADDTPFAGSLFVRYTVPEFQVYSVSVSNTVLLSTDENNYFVSLTSAPLRSPSAMLLETVNVHREFTFHYFTKKDGKWVEVKGDSPEKQSMMKLASERKEMLNKSTDEGSKKSDSDLTTNKSESEEKEKSEKSEESELVEAKKSDQVTCTKFYFDLNTKLEDTEHYTVKLAKFHEHDYVLVKVRKHHLLQRLLDRNLLVWNNFHSLRVSKLGYMPPEAPTHVCMGFHHAGKHFYRFFYKEGGEWDEYYHYSNVPEALLHMSNQAFSEFTLDLSADNHTTNDYFLKPLNYYNFNLTFGVVSENSRMVKVVDKDLEVWVNNEYKQVFAFVYYPGKNPTAFALTYVEQGNKVNYRLFEKVVDRWFPLFAMNRSRRALLDPLMNFNGDLSEFSEFALDLSVDNNTTKDYRVQTFEVLDQKVLLGLVNEDSNLMKVVDNYLEVWTNDAKKKVTKFGYVPLVNPTEFALQFVEDKFKGFSLYFQKRDGRWYPDESALTRKSPLALWSRSYSSQLPGSTMEQTELEDFESESVDTKKLEDSALSDKSEKEENEKSNLSRFRTKGASLFKFNTFTLDLSVANSSNKDYDLDETSVLGEPMAYGVVKPTSNLTKVVDGFNKVWVNNDSSKVFNFAYAPPKNPTLFAVVYKRDGSPSVDSLTKVNGEWVPLQEKPEFTDKLLALAEKIDDEHQAKLSVATDVVFDLFLDLKNDFFKNRYKFELFLFQNLVFYSFVPLSHVNVTEVTESFSLIYDKLSDEKVDRVSFYPKNNPQLLMVEVSSTSDAYTDLSYDTIRKFVKVDDKWVQSEDKFDERVDKFLGSDPSLKSLDLEYLLAALKNNTTQFTDFEVGKDTLNNSVQVLIVGPKNNKKVLKVMYGKQLLWAAKEKNESLQSCFLLPAEQPELMSLHSTTRVAKYFNWNKVSSSWDQVDESTFEHLSTYHSGTVNTLYVDELADFEDVVTHDDHVVNVVNDPNKSSYKLTKTRYHFLATGIMKSGNLLFGLVSRKRSVSNNLVEVKDRQHTVYKLADNEKLLHLFYFPFVQPSLLSLSTIKTVEKDNTTKDEVVKRYFVRSTVKRNGVVWMEVNAQHFNTLLDLVKFTSQYSPVTLATTEVRYLPTSHSAPLKDFVFDLKVHKQTKESYVVKKLSNDDEYYVVVVLGGHRMVKIYDMDMEVYTPRDNEYILDLYYSLDPDHTVLSVKNLTVSATNSKMVGFLSFMKQGNEWVLEREFKMTPTDFSHLLTKFDVPRPKRDPEQFSDATELVDSTHTSGVLSSTEEDFESESVDTKKLEDSEKQEEKEFVFDLSLERGSTEAFNMTRHTTIDDDYSVVVASGHRMVKLVDKDQVLFETPADVQVNSLYYTPAKNPLHLTVRMSTLDENKKDVLLYSYFLKKDGKWRKKRTFSVSPSQLSTKETNKTMKVTSYAVKDPQSTESEKKSHRTYTDLKSELGYRYTDKDGALYPDEEVSTSAEIETETETGVPASKTPKQPKSVVFDFSVNKESGEGYTVVSSSEYYSSVQFSRGYRLIKLLDGNELIYEPRPSETVTSIYYTPRETPDYLTLRTTSTSEFNNLSERVEYVYMQKKDGKWTKMNVHTPPEFVEVPLKDKEFDLNVNNLEEDKAYTLFTSPLLSDPYVSVQPNHGYRLSKLVDGDTVIYTPDGNEKITIVYCDPPKSPNKLTVWYTTECEKCNKLPITSYVYLQKVDGKWELPVPKNTHSHELTKVFKSPTEFTFDLSKDKYSGPNFDLTFEFVQGVEIATVWPRSTSRLVKLVYDTYLVWEPTPQETCTRVLFGPVSNPRAATVVYHQTSGPDSNKDAVKYFVRNYDGSWNETTPEFYVRVLYNNQAFSPTDVKLNFEDVANRLMSNVGLKLGSLLSPSNSSSKTDSTVSMHTHQIPNSVTVTSLYDGDQLVHKSLAEDLVSFQLFANSTDMFLKITSDLFDNKFSHFYRSTFTTPSELSSLLAESRKPKKSENPDAPVKCAEFDYDLSVDHHCTKQYSVRHTKLYGHDLVLVTVKKHNKLVKLLDGEHLLWKQHDHKYAVKFGYMPPSKPTHLCVGVYHLKDHKVKYRFLFKEQGRWKHFTSMVGVPPVLYSGVKLLEASDVTYDLSHANQSTDDYLYEVEQYLDLSYSVVRFNQYSNLTSVVDGFNKVWVNKGAYKVKKFVYYPASGPEYFMVKYHTLDDPTHSLFEYAIKKGDEWYPTKYPRHPRLFEKTLKIEGKNAVFPPMFELSSKYEPGTLVVDCSKFEFDLSVENHCNKHYSLHHKKYNGYDYVLVEVHKYHKLTVLMDGEATVWKNDGYQFVLNFAYLPPKSPTEVYMTLYCLKAHVTYKKFFYKLGGEWHEHPHKSKSYLSKLLRELDTTSFDFNLSGHNQNFVYFKEFVDAKGFNLVEVDDGYKLDSLFDSGLTVWKNSGTKNVQKFLYYPSDKPKHLAVAYYRDDVEETSDGKLLFEYLNKVNGKWEHEMVPEPLVKTLENFSSANTEGLVVKLNRKWRKIDPTEFYNSFLHMSIVKNTTDFDIQLQSDEGIYEVKEGFEFNQPVRISNPLPGTHVSNVLDDKFNIWKATEPNQHAKSIMVVYKFNSVKNYITYEPKLVQVYVKNRDKIAVKYFNKTSGTTSRNWEEIDSNLFTNIYNELSKSELKDKYFEMLAKQREARISSTEVDDDSASADVLGLLDSEGSDEKVEKVEVEKTEEKDSVRPKEFKDSLVKSEESEKSQEPESLPKDSEAKEVKKQFNFNLASCTLLSPHYRLKLVKILDEYHLFVAVTKNSVLRNLFDRTSKLPDFVAHECRGFSFFPRQNPTEVLASFKNSEGRVSVKYYVKENDQWTFKSDRANTIRLSNVLINLDVHLASTELLEYKRLNQQKLEESDKQKQVEADLLLTVKYKFTDPKTKMTHTRYFEYNLNKSENHFGLYTHKVNEFHKLYVPSLDQKVLKVSQGDFVFYMDNLSEKRVVSLSTTVNKDNKLTRVVVTLVDNNLFTHLAYTLDSGVWVKHHLLPSESSQLSEDVQNAQSKLYSHTLLQ